MKILIVGGGIAGTTLAYFLQEKHEVTIIEKSPAWRTIGYGIGIWENGLKILRKLPLPAEFWNSGYEVARGSMLSSKGDVLNQMSFDIFSSGKSVAVTFEREILHKAIDKLLTDVRIRFNTTISTLSLSEANTEVEFQDGTKEIFNLVVGADGIRSKIRSMVFGEKIKSYGYNILGMWVAKSTAHFPGYYILSTKGETMISIPYHDKCVIGLLYKTGNVDYPQSPQSMEEIFTHFPVLKEKLKNIVFSIFDPGKMFADSLVYVEMNAWYKNRVVLIGDARHGMSPLTGMGTSLALEDAYVLADELNKNQNIDEALKNFSRRRDRKMRSVKIFRKLIESASLIDSEAGERVRDSLVKVTPLWFGSYLLKKIFQSKL